MYGLGASDPRTSSTSFNFGYQTPTFGSYQGITFTGAYAFPNSSGLQISVGTILQDFGDWIKTTAGDLLKVVTDELGRRIVAKTGEVLAQTPLGSSTAYAWARNRQQQAIPYVAIGAAVLVGALLLKG